MTYNNLNYAGESPNQAQALVTLGALTDAFTHPMAAQFLGISEQTDADLAAETTAEPTASEIPALAMAYMRAGRLLVDHVREAVASGVLVAQPAEPIDDRSEATVHSISSLELAPPAPLSNRFNLQILLESADISLSGKVGHPAEHILVVRDGNVGQLRVTAIDSVFSTGDGGQNEVTVRGNTLEVAYEVCSPDGSVAARTSVEAEESRHKDPETRVYNDDVLFEAANAVREWSDYAEFGFGKREALARAAYMHATQRYIKVSRYLAKLVNRE